MILAHFAFRDKLERIQEQKKRILGQLPTMPPMYEHMSLDRVKQMGADFKRRIKQLSPNISPHHSSHTSDHHDDSSDGNCTSASSSFDESSVDEIVYDARPRHCENMTTESTKLPEPCVARQVDCQGSRDNPRTMFSRCRQPLLHCRNPRSSTCTCS